MAIYRDVGHEAEFAIPISLISRAKRHSHAYETHVKSEAPTLLRSPTASERDRHHAWSLPPFFPGCSSRQGLSSRSLAGEQPNYRNARCLSSLPSWSDGDDIAPGRHTRTSLRGYTNDEEQHTGFE